MTNNSLSDISSATCGYLSEVVTYRKFWPYLNYRKYAAAF